MYLLDEWSCDGPDGPCICSYMFIYDHTWWCCCCILGGLKCLYRAKSVIKSRNLFIRKHSDKEES